MVFFASLLFFYSFSFAQSPKTEIEYPSFWDLTPPSDFAGWVAYVVKLLLLVGILLAVLQIVWAGVKYTSSSVDPSQKQDAKDRLKYAIIGLILLFSFFVILQTMSQGLARIALKTPPTPTGKWGITIQKIGQYITALPSYITGKSNCYAKYSISCLDYPSGSSYCDPKGGRDVEKDLVTIDFMGKSVRVNKYAKADFEAVVNEIKAAGITYNFWEYGGVQTYCCRRNVNNPTKHSPHSYGIAVDIHPDAPANRNVRRVGGQPCKTDIPAQVVAIFKKHNFIWGGNFRNVCDSMHFEWTGSCL